LLDSCQEKDEDKKIFFYNILIIFIGLIPLSITALPSAAADNSALMKLITQNEDP